MRQLVFVVLIVVGLMHNSIACTGNPSEGKSGSAARADIEAKPSREPPACSARIATMRARLRRVAVVGIEPSVAAPKHLALVDRARLDRAGRSFQIVLTRSEIIHEGRKVDGKDFAAILKREAALSTEATVAPTLLFIAAEGDVDATRLMKVASALPRLEPRLVVFVPDTRELPYGELSSSVADVVAEIHSQKTAAERAMFLSRKMSSANSSCGALTKVFGDVALIASTGKSTSDERSEYIVRNAPDAIAACDCEGLDFDLVEGLLLGALDAGPPLGWLPLVGVNPRKRESVADLALRLSRKMPR